MTDLSVTSSSYDFSALHSAMQRYVDDDLLPGVSSAVLVGRDIVDLHCIGHSDREAGKPLDTNTIFRAFSNTKLVTSCAALLLWEEGHFQLDDPIGNHIPALANLKVLKAGATDVSDTEAASGPITIRHLFTHTSGLSYGLDPTTIMGKLYIDRKTGTPATDLEAMVELLAELPLAHQPGTAWEYSMATDVLGRLIEVISGQKFGAFLKARIFEPLGMVDTDFHVPADKQDRFAKLYLGENLIKPMEPGLTPYEFPYSGAFMAPVPRQSGGGGLVTTLGDMVALVRSLVPGENMLLKAETMDLINQNQLPDGMNVRFNRIGEMPGKGYSLVGAYTHTPLPIEHDAIVGELQWGGLAGTHWWISREHNLAGLVMTQRHFAFWHPFSFEFKKEIYDAVLGSSA